MTIIQFRLHKSDTFRQLAPMLVGMCFYSGIVAYLELEYWQMSERSYVKNIPLSRQQRESVEEII